MRAAEKAVIAAATLILLAAFVNRLYTRGGPYFQLPETIVDRVGPTEHELRDALVLLPRIRPFLPRGATVTCFRPRNGQEHYDMANYFAAVGQLPDQHVMPPFTAGLGVNKPDLVEYVVAIGEPFTHPSYAQLAEYPEGRVYKVMR